MHRRVRCAALLVALAAAESEPRTALLLQASSLAPVLGRRTFVHVVSGETLLDVALNHRIGFQQLVRLNPGVSVTRPLPGTRVRLPSGMIEPNAPRNGLVINLPEMRLCDFSAGGKPEVYAIAIGDDVKSTPLGDFAIGNKVQNPVWYVPDSIRAEHPELPAEVPPGPDNPLGDRWLGLGDSPYGLHGTNNESSIGRLHTHGCMRMYTADIHRLYERVPVGTPVHVVYQVLKLGARAGVAYLEVHPDVYDLRSPLQLRRTLRQMLGALDPRSLDCAGIERALREARGVPVAIGRPLLSPPHRRPAADASRACAGRFAGRTRLPADRSP
jgi:L,D-transpeptidase ErfK/SrfK